MTQHIDPNAAHACYAPSSADRWVHCTASAEAIAMLPEQEEGEEAKEGTAAHEEIERIMGPWKETNGAASLHHDVDPDHPAAYGVALVVSYVRGLDPGRLWIEQRVALTPQIWGRCDVAHWDEASATLTIVDYKNGMRAVDAEENSQLRIYAAASIFTHNLPAKWIRYVVVQPNDWRPFVPRVKQWAESADALYAWANKVAMIPAGVKSFTAGDHCRDCPLFGRCDASLDMLKDLSAVIAGLVDPGQVRPEQVAMFLSLRKPIEDQFKKFEKHWQGVALKGNVPNDMKVVTSRPHRAWKDKDDARRLVFERLGADALDPPTPAQAIERGIPEDVVNAMAPRPDGMPVLAFASDKRPEWRVKSAAEMFADVVGAAK